MGRATRRVGSGLARRRPTAGPGRLALPARPRWPGDRDPRRRDGVERPCLEPDATSSIRPIPASRRPGCARSASTWPTPRSAVNATWSRSRQADGLRTALWPTPRAACGRDVGWRLRPTLLGRRGAARSRYPVPVSLPTRPGFGGSDLVEPHVMMAWEDLTRPSGAKRCRWPDICCERARACAGRQWRTPDRSINMSRIVLDAVSKQFPGGMTAVNALDLEAPMGSCGVLVARQAAARRRPAHGRRPGGGDRRHHLHRRPCGQRYGARSIARSPWSSRATPSIRTCRSTTRWRSA